jgi:mono/diheme cytochrome c family protein
VSPAITWPVALLALVLLATSCGSARRGDPVVGPVGLSPAALRGEQVFMRNCHECHPKGEGGLAPSINDKPLPDFLIKLQVRHGLGAMPEFRPEEISNAELEDLIAYLNALRHEG